MAPPTTDAEYNVDILWSRTNETSIFRDLRWFTHIKYLRVQLSSPPGLVAEGFGTVELDAVREWDETNQITSTGRLVIEAFYVPSATHNLISRHIRNATVSAEVEPETPSGPYVFRDNASKDILARLIRRPGIYLRVWLKDQDIDTTTLSTSSTLIPLSARLTDAEKIRFADFLDLFYTSYNFAEKASDVKDEDWTGTQKSWCRRNIGTKEQFFHNHSLDSGDAADRTKALCILRGLQRELSETQAR